MLAASYVNMIEPILNAAHVYRTPKHIAQVFSRYYIVSVQLLCKKERRTIY